AELAVVFNDRYLQRRTWRRGSPADFSFASHGRFEDAFRTISPFQPCSRAGFSRRRKLARGPRLRSGSASPEPPLSLRRLPSFPIDGKERLRPRLRAKAETEDRLAIHS